MPTTKRRRIPIARTVSFFLIRPVTSFSPLEKEVLERIQRASPEIAKACTLFHEFADLVVQKAIAPLEFWMNTAIGSGLEAMASFATGLCRDLCAVQVAVTEQWSNGRVPVYGCDGPVNSLKMLKRQIILKLVPGQANFDLLRKRVLYA